jgi:hypothetical protein
MSKSEENRHVTHYNNCVAQHLWCHHCQRLAQQIRIPYANLALREQLPHVLLRRDDARPVPMFLSLVVLFVVVSR